MKLRLFVCCHSTSIDIRSNSISLFNIIDGLMSPNFPVVLGPLTVLASLDREDGDPTAVQLRLKITQEDRSLADGPLMVDFGPHPGARTFADIGALVVQSPGLIKFSLLKDDTQIGEWTVPVSDIGPQITQQPEAVAAPAAN